MENAKTITETAVLRLDHESWIFFSKKCVNENLKHERQEEGE